VSEREAFSSRWWLRLQLGLALSGGVVWVIGVLLKRDFLTGLGAGLLIAALTLRLGRRSAEQSSMGDDE
jgi:hypothetical protein